MPALVDRIVDAIDWLNGAIGSVTAWMATFMVVIQFGAVIFRFAFGENLIFVQDLVLYLHGMIFMLAAGFLLLRDGHVRVDLIYRDLPLCVRNRIDLCGTVLFLIPFGITLLVLSLPYAISSWQILEGSREVTGLPLVFILKSTVPAFALLILLQGLSNMLRLVIALGTKPDKQ